MIREGLAPSRERAKEWIRQGRVRVDGIVQKKAGTAVEDSARLEVLGDPMPYVSRGGLKLEKALREFGIAMDGRTCLDAGASTGGFTDCMLQRGAARVYAVDVGHDQLAEQLKTDERVISMENTNVRDLTPELLGQVCDFASADVSFISLTKVLPAISACVVPEGELVCLIKPQFEAGRDKVGKKGVVKNPRIHRQVLVSVTQFCESIGLRIENLTFSPVRGPEGNIEYLIHLRKGNGKGERKDLQALIQQAVQASHEVKT